MSAERNARHHAEAFRWYQGSPDMNDDEAGIRDLKALVDAANELLAEAVVQAKDDGMKWQQIGDALGITRQGAMKRYSPKS
ncbi:DNA-directed RNA polymerase specialized sigma24 family protein [Arthrobacter sp. UYP6]|uniref:hypothetical protein n=1 Tax=Arthrobacter sp. UYP6 TaxID=1756378 RepID=UPI00339A9058